MAIGGSHIQILLEWFWNFVTKEWEWWRIKERLWEGWSGENLEGILPCPSF